MGPASNTRPSEGGDEMDGGDFGSAARERWTRRAGDRRIEEEGVRRGTVLSGRVVVVLMRVFVFVVEGRYAATAAAAASMFLACGGNGGIKRFATKRITLSLLIDHYQ